MMRRLSLLVLFLALAGCGGSAPAGQPIAQRPSEPAPAPTGAVAAATAIATATAARPPATAAASPTSGPTASPAATALPAATAAPASGAPAALFPAPGDPLGGEQAQALKPADLAGADLPDLPRYAMTLSVDPKAGTFAGTQAITFTNTTGVALDSLMLRSYVNFPPDVMGDGGTTVMNVTGASLGYTGGPLGAGAPLEVRRESRRTAFRLMLPQPLAPGGRIAVATTFEGTLEPWDDGSWPFLSSYPLLAQWDAAAGDWRADVTDFPDRVYAQSAFYDVTVALPAPYQVFATGSPLTSSSDASGTTTRFVSGPVREWAASFGRFEWLSAATDGVTVTVYQARGAGLDLERLLDMAIGSLRSYEGRFGSYPFRELDLHAMTWRSDAGIEYPGLTLILIDRSVNQRTDFVVAHEVAHQWWYGLVGNDIYREPWLDESFANYSSFIAANDMLGAEAANGYYRQEINRGYENGLANGDPPAGLAIDEYASFNAYYRAIYGKGAVFLHTLRGEVGDEAFFAGMREYYAATRYGIATRDDFQGAMERAAGQPLGELFDAWLGRR